MAGSLNKVTLIGRIGADPETRRMSSGDSVVNLRIATSETWRDKATGERKEKTEWHQVVSFNDHINKVIEAYARKGQLVYVEGSLQTRKWQDQNGNDRYSTETVLQKFRGEFQLLDKPDGAKAEPRSSYDKPRRDTAADLGDTEIPF